VPRQIPVVRGLYWGLSLLGVKNNVRLTPQLVPERFFCFMRAVGLPHGSYSKSCEHYLPVRLRVTGGSRHEIYSRQKSHGSQRF
jgi:hypothetical protein